MRFLTFTLIAAFALLTVGCGGNNNVPVTKKGPTTGPATNPVDEPPVDEPDEPIVEPDEPEVPAVPQDDEKAVAELTKLGAELTKNDDGQITLVKFPKEGADKLLPHLKGLVNLQTLDLLESDVSNGALAELESLPQLRELRLPGAIGDEGVAHLAKLTELEVLSLNWTKISDAALDSLKDLPKLRELDISWTAVSDEKLAVFDSFKALKKLVIEGTDISEQGVTQLREAMPETLVETSVSLASLDKPKSDEDDEENPAEPNRPPAANSPIAKARAVAGEFRNERAKFFADFDKAETDEERENLLKEAPDATPFAQQMLDIAKENAEDDVAFDALMWIVEANDGEGLAELQKQAVTELIEKHLDHDEMAETCERISTSSLSPAAESLLRQVYEKTKDKAVKGTAAYNLALILKEKADAATFYKHADAESKTTHSLIRGSATVEVLVKTEPEPLTKEAAELLAVVEKDYANVVSYRGVLGELAKSDLFELNNLGVGMEAPDIEGVDVDGKVFKLSDYRGKVVVLDFYGNWCAPCRATFPHSREMIERLQNKPFEFLGINSDETRQIVQRQMDNDNITWRSWWDGGSTQGPIASAWNVSSWPTIYVLDQDGVIRFKNFRGGALDAAVDELIAEAEAAPKKPTREEDAKPAVDEDENGDE